MSWRALTPDDVFSEMTAAEVAMLKNIQSGPDAEKVTGLLTRTVRAARGAILAGGNLVDVDDTLLPDQVISDVVAITRWKWLTSFPSLKAFQTDARKTANDDAMKRLDNMATTGKPKTELPLNPMGGVSLVQMPSVQQRHRRMSVRDQEGL